MRLLSGNKAWLALLLLLLSEVSRAQCVEGVVVANERPLQGAVVRAISGSGRTVSYDITDKEGRFSLEVTDAVDSVVFSLLGYTKKTFFRPFRAKYQVELELVPLPVKAAVVTEHKVVSVGDTIKYNVDALRLREDVFLSDMLKRIPGVELDKLGYVKYNGRDINKFYIDGKDILESSYNLATRNLAVADVKEVQVLDNHQPYRILRGVIHSDEAAMNIVLKDKARGRVNLRVLAGIGHESQNERLSETAKASAFYVGKLLSSIDIAGFDNQGYALRNQEFSVSGDNSPHRNTLSTTINNQVASAPLEDRQSLFNTCWEGTTINRFSLSDNSSASLTLKFGDDRRGSFQDILSTYRTTDSEDVILDREEERESKNRVIASSLSFKNNGTRLYFSDRVYADYSSTSSLANITGGLQRGQKTMKSSLNIENDASVSFIVKKSVLSVLSYSQLSEMAEDLEMHDGIAQQVNTRLLRQRLSLSGISNRVGCFRFSAEPVFYFDHIDRKSDLQGLDETMIPGKRSQSYSVGLTDLRIKGRALYNHSPIEAGIDAAVNGSLYSINQNNSFLFLFDASANFRYVAGLWEASLAASAGKRGPNIQQLDNGIILYDYNSLLQRNQLIHGLRFISTTGQVKYRAPISGWNGRIMSVLTLGEAFSPNRILYDEYVLSGVSDTIVPCMTLTSTAELSKGLFSINGKLSLNLEHHWTRFSITQNGQLQIFDSHLISPSAHLVFPLARWWGIDSRIRCGVNKFFVSDVSTSWFYNLYASIKNVFHLSKSLLLSVNSDGYSNSSADKALLFPSVSLRWSGNNGIGIKIIADNLLNVKSYSNSSISPLLEERICTRIRPLTLLLSIDWGF